MKYVINLFGTGIRYWDCHVEKEIFDDMSKIKLKHNGFDHWSELSSNSPRIGFLLKTENTIEIKQGGKLITRFTSSELDEKQVLFPLFRTKLVATSAQGIENHIYIKLLQLEKGLIAKYRFQTDIFSLENLMFNLATIDTFDFLESIQLNSVPLDIVQEDTLIIGTKIIHK